MPILLDARPRPVSVEERLGPEIARARRAMEGQPQRRGRGRKRLPLHVLDPVMAVVRGGLKLAGIYDPLARWAARPELAENEVPAAPGLAGLTVLHLSDLHIDGHRGAGRRLAEACERLSFDVAVVTGDFRFHVEGPFDEVLAEIEPVLDVLRRAPLGAYAVLGNHDPLDLVAPLEANGLRFLLNEGERVDHAGGAFFLAGVDDAHFYGTDDVERALEDRGDEPVLFLCHSPDLVREASDLSLDLYLCGHTHGGQICAPSGRAILANASCPRDWTAGAWQVGTMAGYTSRGAGFSGIPLRNRCPAEVTLHHLVSREARRRGSPGSRSRTACGGRRPHRARGNAARPLR